MIDKVGKVLKSSVKSSKAFKGSINKTTGMLKSSLNSPSGIQKMARSLNNMDDAIGKVNRTYHKKAATKLGIEGAYVSDFANKLKDSGRYSQLSKTGNKLGSKMQDKAANIYKHDKAIGFNVGQAIEKDLKGHINQVTNLAGSMFQKSDKNLLGVKLSKRGALVAGGLALASGSKQASNKFNETTMGTRDPQVTSFSPRIPAYQNNGGATGDLVFALNQNRKG